MAVPGRVPRPAHMKLVNGRTMTTDSGGRPVGPAPAFARGAPEVPALVACNSEAQDMWNLIVPELARLDLLKEVDMAGVAAYCLTWARLCSAQRDIDLHGIVVEGERGGKVRNPACGVADSATRELRMWCQEFGLTPSAEGRLQPAVAVGDDNDEAFDD